MIDGDDMSRGRMIGRDDFISQLRRATCPPRRTLVITGLAVVLAGLVILAIALLINDAGSLRLYLPWVSA